MGLAFFITTKNFIIILKLVPTILHNMEKIIENEDFTERVRMTYFTTLKEEWMKYV